MLVSVLNYVVPSALTPDAYKLVLSLRAVSSDTFPWPLSSFSYLSSFLLSFFSFFFFFAILGFELRAYTLSHSTSPFLVMGFFQIGSLNYLPGLGWLQTAIILISAS
jgi:hypothetical protein